MAQPRLAQQIAAIGVEGQGRRQVHPDEDCRIEQQHVAMWTAGSLGVAVGEARRVAGICHSEFYRQSDTDRPTESCR